jgi:hypothetical protein
VPLRGKRRRSGSLSERGELRTKRPERDFDRTFPEEVPLPLERLDRVQQHVSLGGSGCG